MEKWVISFLAMLNLILFAQGQPDSWIGIDCGSNRTTTTNGLRWQTDEDFIKTGTNYLIPNNFFQSLAILNTLRVFIQQNKNCYTLPSSTGTRYFIRASFFYANYDGLLNPPTFDLQIDGNKWETIVTSPTDFSYYEILYYSQSSSISVCLARTQNDQFPFISSLEAWQVPYTMYNGMSQDLAWLNNYRYNYGSNNGIIWYPDDSYNRIWNPKSVPGSANTTADPGTSLYFHSDESPPDSAVLDAIEAPNGTSLFLSFNPVQPMTAIFIEAYFTEMQSDLSGIRSFDIYAEDVSLGVTVKPEYSTCTAVSHLVQTMNDSLTIELRPTATSLLPPTISAIEIYTASDPLNTNGTDENDCSVIGNRIDDPPCKPTPPPPPPGGGNSKPSAVGPAVGTTVVVILIIVGIVYWLIRRRRRQGNNHTTEPENGMVQDSFMTNGSTANLIRPQPIAHAPNRPTAEEDDDDIVPVSMLEIKPNNNQSMVPVIDLDELEELIDQHANGLNHESYHADLKPDPPPASENGATTNNDQSMAPDLDFDELDQIIKHEKEKARST